MKTITNSEGKYVTLLQWEDVDRLAENVAAQVVASNFLPSVIVGILRGGLVPAVILSHRLKLPTVGAIAIRTTASDQPYANRKDVSDVLVESSHLKSMVNGQYVLLIDDIGNTGRTLRLAEQALISEGASEVRSAILVRDTWGDVYCKADFVGSEISNWVGVPWEPDDS